MSRYSPYNVKSAQPSVVAIHFEFPIGAAGAVGTAVRKRGITSMVRNGAGDYTVTLDDSCQAILNSCINVEAPYAAAEGTVVVPRSRTLGAAPTLRFISFAPSGGGITDPANGAKVTGTIWVQKSSA